MMYESWDQCYPYMYDMTASPMLRCIHPLLTLFPSTNIIPSHSVLFPPSAINASNTQTPTPFPLLVSRTLIRSTVTQLLSMDGRCVDMNVRLIGRRARGSIAESMWGRMLSPIPGFICCLMLHFFVCVQDHKRHPNSSTLHTSHSSQHQQHT